MRTTRLKFAALALACAAIATAAHAKTGAEFYGECGSGPNTNNVTREACHAFVAQIMKGMAQSHHICPAASVTGEQAFVIAQSYMRNNGDQLGQDAAAVVGLSLTAAFPCQ